MSEPTERICECHELERLAADPDSHITFDANVNEYHLVRGRFVSVMRYCFFCGGRLPESTSDRFFMQPDPAEQAQVTSLLKGAKSLAAVIRVLGPADEVISRDELMIEQTIPNEVRWKRTFRYSSRWKTLTIDILEMPDGSFGGCMMSGKHRQ